MAAVEKALDLKPNKLSKSQNNKKYQNPDQLNSVKQELKRIAPTYQPNSKAGKIGENLDINNNKSHSFKIFIDTLKKLKEKS